MLPTDTVCVLYDDIYMCACMAENAVDLETVLYIDDGAHLLSYRTLSKNAHSVPYKSEKAIGI